MSGKQAASLGGAMVAAGFLVLFVNGGSRQALGLVLKALADGFDWERSTIGLAVAVFLITSAVFMFVAGHLADRFSLRAILGGGTLICAIGIGGMSLVTEPWHVLLLYGLIFGLGAGIASPVPVGVLITRRFPGRVGIANAVAFAGMGLGQLMIIASLAAALVELGWQSVFILLGAANLALAGFVVFAFRREPGKAEFAPSAETTHIPFKVVLARRGFWLMVIVYAICGFHDFFVATHIVAFALDHDMGTFFAGNLLAFMGLAGLLGVLLSGAVSDRLGPVGPTFVCFLLRALIFALILSSQSPLAITVYAMVYGLTFWITAPLTVVFVRDAFGTRHLGALSGFITMIHHICGGPGAGYGALQYDADGSYQTAFVVMFATSVIGGLLTLTLRRPAAG